MLLLERRGRIVKGNARAIDWRGGSDRREWSHMNNSYLKVIISSIDQNMKTNKINT